MTGLGDRIPGEVWTRHPRRMSMTGAALGRVALPPPLQAQDAPHTLRTPWTRPALRGQGHGKTPAMQGSMAQRQGFEPWVA